MPFRMIVAEASFGESRPLIVYLHGAGERGTDNQRQLALGTARLTEAATKHGAIVVAPQCPNGDYWANVGRHLEIATGEPNFDWAYRPLAVPSLQSVMALVDSLAHTPGVDSTRIHLVGVSMGAMGVIELATRTPGRYASITSIAGAYGPQVAPILAGGPRLRFYHGSDDHLVDVAITRELVRRVRALGREVKYVEFEGANHNSWDRAFAEADFWDVL